MAFSLSNYLYAIFGFSVFALLSNAATVTHDFSIGWTTANPDGAFERSVIGVNGQFPPPTVYATKGDQIVINVQNDLKNESVALHFHGMFQRGTTHMDGAAGVTQCAIPPGSSFTYNFTADQVGTYWYHSHVKGQYPDGLRAPFIIHDPEMPFKNDYDEEIVLSFSDWYHDMMSTLLPKFLSVSNPSGVEPIPNAAVMNDTQGLKVKVQPGKTYMFRMVNLGAFAAQYVWFEGHTMRIVEVDGVYTEPTETDLLYMTVAQRYSVLLTMKNDTGANFPIMGSMDEEMFDKVPDGLNANVTGWLTYDDSKPFPEAKKLDEFKPFDDFTLVPQDNMTLLPKADHTVNLTVTMQNLKDGANYGFLNDATFVGPKVPTVFSVLTTGNFSTDPRVYGVGANAFILEKNQVVDIVLNNNDPGKHPFHLHGHNFQVIYRSDKDAGAYLGNDTQDAFPETPMRRDVIQVRPGGNVVLRFESDNPGVWLFHCHIEWHVYSGLQATIIEAPLDLQASLKIPDDHYAVCKTAGVTTAGNAAGNTKDPLDLTGANVAPGPLPTGFTDRGIVALVFSCVAAFIGCAVIAWYGFRPIGK